MNGVFVQGKSAPRGSLSLPTMSSRVGPGCRVLCGVVWDPFIAKADSGWSQTLVGGGPRPTNAT